MSTTPQPITVEQVEAFFMDRLNEMQAAVPEYATLSFLVSRGIYDGQFQPEDMKWQGYFSSGAHFPVHTIDRTRVELSRVMAHVAVVAKHRDPVNIAAKLREQAARLLAQAEQAEKNIGATP